MKYLLLKAVLHVHFLAILLHGPPHIKPADVFSLPAGQALAFPGHVPHSSSKVKLRPRAAESQTWAQLLLLPFTVTTFKNYP